MKPEDFAELRRLARHDANVRATRQRDRQAVCSGKHRFASYEQAKATLRRKGRDVTAYHCPECGGYHVGSASNNEKRSKASLSHIKRKIERRSDIE